MQCDLNAKRALKRNISIFEEFGHWSYSSRKTILIPLVRGASRDLVRERSLKKSSLHRTAGTRAGIAARQKI